ncbi:MAG: PEGA domain-containing protein, partial [Myxococcota bacterium]|nr:PEGA domain-containing protein [Myxococcota bacterium]
PPAVPEAAQEDTVTRARVHFTAGRAAMEAERWEEALTEFSAANDLLPAARALYNVGLALRKLGRDIEALRTYRTYLTTYAAPTSERDITERREVENVVEEIRDAVGSVRVNVAVSGATVFVDGRLLGPSPLSEPVEMIRGQHTFRAEAEGHRPAEETVQVQPGQEMTVTLVPAPLRTTAAVDLSSNVPGAVAMLDGEILGPLPFSGEVPAGIHRLVVSAAGYETAHMPISLEAGQPFRRSIELVAAAEPVGEDEWYEKWWVWTIAGVVVGGATAGIIIGTTGGEEMPATNWPVTLP